MTEQEALKYFNNANRTNNMLCILPKSDIGKCIIKALEEVLQYRAIGTPEECRTAVEKQKELKSTNTYGFVAIGKTVEQFEQEIRNKSIDDFSESCKQNIMCQTFGLKPRNIDELAEQLKAGDRE